MTISTPYYEISEEQLEYNVSNLESAINKYWKNTIVGYSFKTNSLVAVCEYMKRRGYYAEVVSTDEYELAKLLEFDSKKIIYNGPCKTKEALFEALDNDDIVNLDGMREIDWVIEYSKSHGKKISVGIRVNFKLEEMCKGETAMGKVGSRFGFTYENGDVKKVVYMLAANGIGVSGLHLHNSSKTRSIAIYDAITKKAVEIAKTLNLSLRYVDVGGGFFGGVKGRIDFYDYFEIMRKNLLEYFDENLTLIVEPGASVVASAIKYVTSVIDVKDNSYGVRIVVTDGSRIHIDPLMQKARYDYEIESENSVNFSKQSVCGFTCMEHDVIMDIEDKTELHVGDKITYNKVGSYSMTLSPLFIGYFPGVYFVEKDGNIECVREKWKAEQLIQKQKVIR